MRHQDERQNLAARDIEAAGLGEERDLPVSEDASELLAAAGRVRLQALLQVENDRHELVGRRQGDRRHRLPVESTQPRPFCLQLPFEPAELLRESREPPTVGDEVDELVPLPDHLLDPLPLSPELLAVLALNLTETLGELLARVRNALIGEEPAPELVEDVRPNDALANGKRVLAYAALRVALTPVIGVVAAAADDHFPAADPAHEEAAEEVRALPAGKRAPLRLVAVATRVEAVHLLEPLLDRLPRVWVDDPELRTLRDDGLVLSPANGNASIGPRDLAPLRRAILPSSDVALVVEYRADRRVLPTRAAILRVDARRLDAVLIQHLRDCRERTTLEVQTEDPPNDGRALLDDLDPCSRALAVRSDLLPKAVAEGHTARREARKRPSFEPTDRLVAQVAQVDGRDEALQAERQRGVPRERIDAVSHADQPDFEELQEPLQREQIGRGPREPRQVLDDEHIDPRRFRGDEPHEAFVSEPVRAGTARRAIGEDQLAADGPPVGQDEFPAAPYLILDARFALRVRREPRVDGYSSPLEFRARHSRTACSTRKSMNRSSCASQGNIDPADVGRRSAVGCNAAFSPTSVGMRFLSSRGAATAGTRGKPSGPSCRTGRTTLRSPLTAIRRVM